jgi:hypothetical protein
VGFGCGVTVGLMVEEAVEAQAEVVARALTPALGWVAGMQAAQGW